MKNIILILALALSAATVQAQYYVNGKPLEEITGYLGFKLYGQKVMVDDGGKTSPMKDAAGNEVKSIQSFISLLNMLEAKGWKFVTVLQENPQSAGLGVTVNQIICHRENTHTMKN